jgi:hypothetical protein
MESHGHVVEVAGHAQDGVDGWGLVADGPEDPVTTGPLGVGGIVADVLEVESRRDVCD